MYGELEGSWGRPDFGYAHGGGSRGVSDLTSNLRRSKSFRYSMARGLGGREGMGREGEDMISAAAAAGGFQQGFSVCQDCWKVQSSSSVQLIDSSSSDVRKSTAWCVSSVRNCTLPFPCLCSFCPSVIEKKDG